jgi:nitroimidazol reductase NimA-like FMN-containing flavoprotein (pyridoxamine 5'-phosphate oxidase superfamily)
MAPRITLDDPALVDFLRRNHRAFLFCRDECGHPIGYPMRSITYEPGRLYFSTYSKSAKTRHLLADPEAACLVTSEDTVRGAASWVSVQGRAQIYQPAQHELEMMLQRSSPEGRVPEAVVTKVRDRSLTGKRCFLRLDIEQVPAFDLQGAGCEATAGNEHGG